MDATQFDPQELEQEKQALRQQYAMALRDGNMTEDDIANAAMESLKNKKEAPAREAAKAKADADAQAAATAKQNAMTNEAIRREVPNAPPEAFKPEAPKAAPAPTAEAPKPEASAQPKEGDKKILDGQPATFTGGKWTYDKDVAKAPPSEKKPSTPAAGAPSESTYGIMDKKKREETMEKLDKISYSLPEEKKAEFDARRKEIQTLINDADQRFADREKTIQYAEAADIIGQALAKLAAGYYGMKTGVDLSGVPFKPRDWQKDMDRIYDHYDKTVSRQYKAKESVNQDQEQAEKTARDIGKDQASTLSELLKSDTSAKVARGRDVADINTANARLKAQENATEAKTTAKEESEDAKAKAREDKELNTLAAQIANASNKKDKKKSEELSELYLRRAGVPEDEIKHSKEDGGTHWFRPDVPTLQDLVKQEVARRARNR